MNAAFSIGDIISAGGTLTFAYVVWTEVKLMRVILDSMNKRLAILEERSRASTNNTPARGIPIMGTLGENQEED